MNSQHKIVKLSSTICATCISVISIIFSYFFDLTDKSWWPVFAFISLLVILYSLWFDIVLCKKKDNEKIKNDINNYKNQIINNAQIKEKLAQTVRKHYKKHPDSLKYQASGNTIPNTVNNHKI